MTLQVGVIGTGMIGQDHIRRITHTLSGAEITAVTDVNADAARQTAASLKNATVHENGHELITDDAVDAVLVASWGPTHEEYVLSCIAVGKPVFCEKPLATTQQACLAIIDAEVAVGRRLIQVGFMRRFDAGYRALKGVVDSGAIGAPLIYYSGHRNPSVPGHYTRDMAIVDTAVHDFDITRWLLGEELTGIRVLTPKRSRHGGDLQDPLLMILDTASGVLVNVETSVNIRYGYDIRGEVVGEDGTAALADQSPVVLRRGGAVSGEVPQDWRVRFTTAYDNELQDWIDAVSAGKGATGPSSWDGYAAQAVCDAGLQALHSGVWAAVKLIDKPAIYCGDSGEH
jgi:myo-inositol 2-dehydrogenase/D-chiro-inositol 1-dehydrogenase